VFSGLGLAAFALIAAALDARAQTPAAPPPTAECAAAFSRLDAAIKNRQRGELEKAGFDMGGVPGCDPDIVTEKRRDAARILVDLADSAAKAGVPRDELNARYLAARRVAPVWQVLKGLADISFDAQDFKAAARLYGDLWSDLDDPRPGDTPPPPDLKDWAFERASETQMLAPVIVPPKRDGTPGGIDAALETGQARDLVPRARPLPVTYEYDSANMTQDGKVFASRWWDQIKVLDSPVLTLVGHTDPRGSAPHNETLAIARAETLAKFLKEQGFEGNLVTVGFGFRCPVNFSTGAHYTQEQQWQIDRRVEVIAAGDLPPGFCNGQTPTRGP
jgi:hypothetical protein